MRRHRNEGSSEQEEARRERERERRVERPEPGRYHRDDDERAARSDLSPRGEIFAGDRSLAEPWERDVTMRREDGDWRDQERNVHLEHRAGRLGGYYDRLEFGGEERRPVSGYERDDYGFGDRGMQPQAGWRGPGVMPGYREARDPGRARGFSQNPASGGQTPGEMREWGRRGDRGERRVRGEYPMRESWRHGPAGPGPDADRGPDGRRRSLEGRDRGTEPGPHAGRGPKNYRRADARVHEEICDRLMQHSRIDASEIEVQVSEGRVVLSGIVPDRETKHRAEDLAESILGVTEVDNRLRVGRSDSSSRGRGDQGQQH